MIRYPRVAAALGVLFLLAQSAAAQSIRVSGYGEPDLDALIRGTLARRHVLFTRDTVITAGDTIRDDVVVIDARFVLEGTIIGSLTGVDANMYLRPNSRVTGTLTNIAGGLYPSEQARIGILDDRPLAPYSVRREGDAIIVEGTVKRPAVALDGIFGFQNPEYNRVDGLRAEWGPSILLPPVVGVEPRLSGSIGYATETEDLLWRARLLLKRGRSTLTFGYENNITITNDEWIRASLKNSLSAVWNGKDYRNYYQADRAYAEFARLLERGSRVTQYWVRGQMEESRSLVARDVFSVLDKDSVRFNPLVPEIRLTSLIVGAQSDWTGPTTVWSLRGHVELAGGDVFQGDDAFNAYALQAKYAMQAIANHTLEVETYFRGPLPGTESLPLQRWTHVGGSGTLYTFEIAQFRGDRLAFVETEYSIPFARQLRLPVIGRPKLMLMHNIGMAWSQLIERDFEQNIGARLQFPFAFARVVTNPENFNDDAEFSIGVTFPTPGYPWERDRPPVR